MDSVPASAVVAGTAAGGAPSGGGGGAVVAAAPDYVEVVRRFLREVGGVPEAIVDNGSWAGLVGYTQGRFA